MENSFSYQPAAGRYERMPYKYCGKSGLQLPLISLGLWHNFGSVDNFDVATDMIKYAFDHGVTHFDLANNYGPLPGSAEINFGRILRENFQGYRDEMIISSKVSVGQGWSISTSFIAIVMMELLRSKKPFRH